MQLTNGWLYLLFVFFGALTGYIFLMQYRLYQYRKELYGLCSRLDNLENQCKHSRVAEKTPHTHTTLLCHNCGKPRKADDQRCPYCHEPL